MWLLRSRFLLSRSLARHCVRTLASRALFDGAGADPSNVWSRRVSPVVALYTTRPNQVRDATMLEAASGLTQAAKGHCFVIELPDRHYVISASSPEEKVEWKVDIAKILLGLGKDPDAKSQPVVPKGRSAAGGMATPKVPDMPDATLPDAGLPDAKLPSADVKVPDVADVAAVDEAEAVEAVEEEEAVGEIVRTMTVSQAGKEAPAEIIREAALAKKGEIRTSWKSRWFVMYAKSIAYLDKKGGKVKGGILFEDAHLVSRLRIGCGWFLLSRSLARHCVGTLASRALFDGAGADPIMGIHEIGRAS